MLEIRKLTKVYPNGTRALHEIDLTIQQGEFVVLLGLSGSGKSTLLRCINRLIEPTSGDILLDGRNITQAPRPELRRIRREIGMIFQQFNLIKRARVLTNVMAGNLGYQPTAWSFANYFPSATRTRALENLQRVGILDKAYVRADSLSGGQQQRVGIARALMQHPRMMLADEPVASLDPATSHSVMHYLEEINHTEKVTVICSLHFLSLARRYATRIVALKDGQLVYDGPPSTIDDERFRAIYGEDAVEVEIR